MSATSAVVLVTIIIPVAISNSLPQIANGRFSFDYSADPGLVYLIQNSSNLVDWVPLGTNTAAINPVHFTDELIFDLSRFYRVSRLPNPE